MSYILIRKTLAIIIISIFLSSNFAVSKNIQNSENLPSIKDELQKEIYIVPTKDKSSITLTRYNNTRRPSIMFIHGMGCNHKIYDYDENHSLAQFLAKDGWDVWMLDLRTHDGDGDFLFGKLRGIDSDMEFICKYWDFDRTYLKIDVVTAIDFIKEKTNNDKIFFSGHSYGGYLAYAYAELFGEENLTDIITTAASGVAMPLSYAKKPH